MHVVTHLSEKYEKLRKPENGWTIEEAGMAQLDDIVGSVMKKLKDNGLDDNTIVAFTTDNGAENFTWPDGGQTPFAGGKGTVHGRRLPRALHRFAGRATFRQARSRTGSSPGWTGSRPSSRLPATRTSPRNSRRARSSATATYKVHLDGYDQMDLITGKGRRRATRSSTSRESTLGAVRIDDYKYPLHRSAERLAGRNGQGGLADPHEPAA